MRFLTKYLPLAAVAGLLAGTAPAPAAADGVVVGVDWRPPGHYYRPPPPRYYRPPPPRYYRPPPPPYYYRPPPVYYPPPPPRYYRPPPPPPGVGLYFRF
jgi:hypothetical protein